VFRSPPAKCAAMVAVLALSACSPNRGPSKFNQTPEVGVVVLQQEQVTLQVDLPGRTSAFESSDVRPQVSGVIQARLFKEGANVRAGQSLYRIDPAPFNAAYQQALGQLANAQASLTVAALKDARYADLVKMNAVSQQEADDARASHEQAAAAVQSARGAVQGAKVNLDYTRVTAPISGRIGRSAVTPGALVIANQATPLTSIQRLDQIYVDVTQPATDLLDLQRALQSGRVARGQLSAHLILQDGSAYEPAGKLSATDVTVDPNTGSVTLRAIFPNPKGLLLPGMYVRAIIDEGVEQDAILAPQQGVTRDERGRANALVVDAAGKASLRILTTGRTVGDKWLVTSGLAAGDKLIVEGLLKAKPGGAVHAVPAGSPPRAQKPPPGKS